MSVVRPMSCGYVKWAHVDDPEVWPDAEDVHEVPIGDHSDTSPTIEGLAEFVEDPDDGWWVIE